MCLIMRCTPNSALVDRVDVATPLSLSSRSVTSLSALAPAQRAGAQRLCALAHRDLASRIHVRNAPKADKPEPTRMTHKRHSPGDRMRNDENSPPSATHI